MDDYQRKANVTGTKISVWLTGGSRFQPHYVFTADRMIPGAQYQSYGDFGRNFWFSAKISKTVKLTLRNAIFRIKAFYGDAIEQITITPPNRSLTP